MARSETVPWLWGTVRFRTRSISELTNSSSTDCAWIRNSWAFSSAAAKLTSEQATIRMSGTSCAARKYARLMNPDPTIPIRNISSELKFLGFRYYITSCQPEARRPVPALDRSQLENHNLKLWSQNLELGCKFDAFQS